VNGKTKVNGLGLSDVEATIVENGTTSSAASNLSDSPPPVTTTPPTTSSSQGDVMEQIPHGEQSADQNQQTQESNDPNERKRDLYVGNL